MLKWTASCVIRIVSCLSFTLCVQLWDSTMAASYSQRPPNPFIHPGKIDLHYRYTNSDIKYNLIWWTPVFKGGIGIIDFDNKTDTKYLGGFLKPLLPRPEWGDLTVGFHRTDINGAGSYELQGEYTFPVGLGLSGGLVERNKNGPNVLFGEVSYRNKWSEWDFILGVRRQEIADDASLGGSFALYDKNAMLTFSYDKEQWRTVLGYISPINQALLKPAFEFLWLDNEIGVLDGPRVLFLNATLDYSGGFLSHPARLGRAMGPTGLEFGNPIGFLSPTWNRRLELEELGSLVNFRLLRSSLPNGVTTGWVEALVYPFQFDSNRNFLDFLYLGGVNADGPGSSSSGILSGLAGTVGSLRVSIKLKLDLNKEGVDVVIGVINVF